LLFLALLLPRLANGAENPSLSTKIIGSLRIIRKNWTLLAVLSWPDRVGGPM